MCVALFLGRLLICLRLQVLAGEYRLSALPVDTEGSSSLMFSPGFIDVNVNSPLLDIEFSQVTKNATFTYVCSVFYLF